MIRITRIGIGSAAKIGAVLSAILWAVFGLLWLLLQGLFAATILSSMTFATSSSYGGSVYSGRDLGMLSAISLGTLVCGYLIGIVVAAISGAISGAVIAFGFNLAVRLVGGLEVQMTGGVFERPGTPQLVDEIDRDLKYKAAP